MAGTAARYAFVTLAVTAKLHRLLDTVGGQQERQREQALEFDDHLASTLHELEQRDESPVRREARHAELSLIKGDFDRVEQLYRAYREHTLLSKTTAERFDRIFSDIREKISQKELAL
jgi:hypothetical protein